MPAACLRSVGSVASHSPAGSRKETPPGDIQVNRPCIPARCRPRLEEAAGRGAVRSNRAAMHGGPRRPVGGCKVKAAAVRNEDAVNDAAPTRPRPMSASTSVTMKKPSTAIDIAALLILPLSDNASTNQASHSAIQCDGTIREVVMGFGRLHLGPHTPKVSAKAAGSVFIGVNNWDRAAAPRVAQCTTSWRQLAATTWSHRRHRPHRAAACHGQHLVTAVVRAPRPHAAVTHPSPCVGACRTSLWAASPSAFTIPCRPPRSPAGHVPTPRTARETLP